MGKQIQIPDSEWEVMKVLWKNSPATVNEVANVLSGTKNWHAKTVRTLLNRLVDKGILNKDTGGSYQYYRPLLSKDDCVSAAGDSFLEKVFDGALAPMIAHFVKQRALTKEERAELEKILNEDKS